MFQLPRQLLHGLSPELGQAGDPARRRSATSNLHPPASQQQPVANRHQHHVDPLIVPDLSVERADRSGLLVLMRRISDPAVPKRIVDRDQPARPHQLQAVLVVAVVILLIGIDEGEIEAALLARGAKRGQRLGGGREPQLDAVRDPSLAPIALRRSRPFLVHVAADELAVRRQRQRHRKRAVAGEGRDRARANGVKFGPKHKLTPHQRQEALARRAAGEALTSIARSYNVAHTTIMRLETALQI